MKTFSLGFRHVIIVLVLLLSSTYNQAQVKGLYVDFFGNYILQDASLKTNLINYAAANGFNYLLLYDVQGNVLDYTLCSTCTLNTDQELLKDFISSAKGTITGLQIGVSGGAMHAGVLSEFFDNVKWFNDLVANNEKIDVMHLEDEYWNGTPSDLESQYDVYIDQLGHMWAIRNSSVYPLTVETYLGEISNIPTRPESLQVAEIDPVTDRILLHCYMPNQFMQNRLSGPGFVNMQFEYDWGSGKRYKYFASNQKETKIIPIFSAEACDIGASTTNYYGDYLWFNGILTNGTACPASTATLLNYPFLPLTFQDDISQPLADFNNSYVNNTDPYNDAGNPSPPAPAPRGFPCGIPDAIASCTDISNVTDGNSIIGEMWFKYGLMPLKDNFKPLYLDCGIDQAVQPNANCTIQPIEYLSNIAATIGSSAFHVIQYNWYKNGEYVSTTFPVSPDYIVTASGTPFETDTYTCEIVTNQSTKYFHSYRIRDDIKITSDPQVGISFYLSYSYTPATCPDFNNGSITVYPQGCGCSASYTWNNGQYTQAISNLAPGTYTVTATNNYNSAETATAYITIPTFDNSPNPVIFNSNPFLSCNNELSVTPRHASYQWFLNNSPISGASGNTYSANQSGSYTVEVTTAAGCTGTSSAYAFDMNVNANISGSPSTCGNTQYTVPDAGPGAIYSWQLPSGASYFQNKNYIDITWGSAYSTGGEIKCTVTNACGTSAIGSIQVTPFSLTDASTYACPGMSNGSAGVTANGGPAPYTYLWNSGSNTIAPIMNNLSAGSYTVTVTNAINCTATVTTTVNNFPTGLASPIISGTSSASPGTHIYSLSNYHATYDNYYSWVAIANTGNAVISYPNSNKQTASIQWPASGGRIEVKFGVVGCQETVVYYVQPYCTNTYTYPDGSNQSNITTANTITRANMSINGFFNVTNDFTFKDCGQVAFAAGAKVIVASGKTLTIDNCTFGPGTCCKMWKGIELESGAKVIVKNGSTITQAEYGIVVNAGAIYEITDAYFQNNYVSLQVGTGSSTSTTGSKIENTDFYSTPYACGGTTYNNFAPKYDGQITNPGSLPLAGIKADNVTYMKFGSSTLVSGGDVRFNNLNNGVLSNNSNLYIQNSRFTNMLPGCGIQAEGGIINVIGLGGDYATSTNTFENCQWGINASRCDLTVNSVRSNTDVNTAVYFTDCGMVYINNNALGAKYYGIRGYNNPNSNIVIEKNSIHMSTNPVSSACIRIDEFGLDNPVTIDHNDLYLNHSRYGIVTYGMNNALIKENYIQMNNISNIAGIRSYYSLKNTFQCNTIFALNRYNSYQSGIALSLSPENSINCNWMSNQFEGLGIRGACSPLEIKGNVFNDHAFGLNLTFNGLMGVQTNHGNQWNGNYTYYGAYLSGINSASAQANQVLFYDPNSNGTMPTTTNDIMNLDWFLENGNPDEFDCAAYDCQPFIPLEANDRIEDEIIAEEDEIGTEYVEPSNYFADRFLFDRLTDDPDLMTNNNILLAFYNQKLYGSIGQFNEMNQEIEEAVKWETVYHIVYATNESMIRTAVDSLNIMDSLYASGYNGPSNYDDLNQTIATLSESNELLRETIEQIKNFRIENAIDNNELIQVSDQYEENEAIVNNIYLESVAAGKNELTSEQITSLLQVAIQCPFTGGPSVYKARSLYFLADEEADWDDDAICISNGVQPRMSKAEAQYSLFPNPTTGIITLKYHIESEDRAMLNVYTTLGVLISSTALDADNPQIEVDLSSFKPALYHYKIMVNDQQKRQGMISIIR